MGKKKGQMVDQHMSVTGNSTERDIDKKVSAKQINVELPPGFHDKSFFSCNSDVAEFNFVASKISKLTALDLTEDTNLHVVGHHYEEVLSKAEAHQTLKIQSTPKQKSAGVWEIEIASQLIERQSQ